MGRKPVGKRQCFLLHLAVGLIGLILSSGCQHFQTEVPATISDLAQAEACWRIEDFACAERALIPALNDATGQVDPRAIYLAGLVAVDLRNPAHDFQKACQYFQRVVADHADSALAAAAAAWLGVISQVQSQAEDIERLEAANTCMQRKIKAHKADLHRMEKRLERLKAVDLSVE
ncbi:MAG: hypothetical protein JJV98_06790 [Desulfosarcina sp.]|nr:hypothetical protein [Desulfobacterales bacterium]